MTKIRDKCVYVMEVRDPVKTSSNLCFSMTHAPDGFWLGNQSGRANKKDGDNGRIDKIGDLNRNVLDCFSRSDRYNTNRSCKAWSTLLREYNFDRQGT